MDGGGLLHRPRWRAGGSRLSRSDRCRSALRRQDDRRNPLARRSHQRNGQDGREVRIGPILLCRCPSGWTAIISERTRPPGRASVFKVPHHGSATADAPEVWRRMLEPEPFAIVAPWSRGGKTLPTSEDVTRILSRTVTAYASANLGRSAGRQDELRVPAPPGTSVRLRSKRGPLGLVRLRRTPGDRSWRVDLLGSALRLSGLAA